MKGEEILDLVRRMSGKHDWQFYDEINDAYETICRKAGFWFTRIRDENSFTFENGKTSYSLPLDQIRRLEGVAIKDNEDFQEWRTLEEVGDDLFDRKVFAYRNMDATDQKDVPRYYRLSADSVKHLEVTPTPDGSYPMRLIYIGNPPKIEASTVPVLPENYHRILVKLAAAKLLQLPPFTDAKSAQAATLMRDYREAMFPLALDTAPNRVGTGSPKRRIMRS